MDQSRGRYNRAACSVDSVIQPVAALHRCASWLCYFQNVDPSGRLLSYDKLYKWAGHKVILAFSYLLVELDNRLFVFFRVLPNYAFPKNVASVLNSNYSRAVPVSSMPNDLPIVTVYCYPIVAVSLGESTVGYTIAPNEPSIALDLLTVENLFNYQFKSQPFGRAHQRQQNLQSRVKVRARKNRAWKIVQTYRNNGTENAKPNL